MIYFIQQGKTGAIKIGYTKNSITKRIVALQSASPHKLNLLCILEGTEKQERALHNLFSPYKLQGEWFESHPTIMMFLFNLIFDKTISFKRLNSSLDEYLKNQEISIISLALAKTNFNITKSAELLGISFRSLRHRIYKYKLKK